MREVTIGTVLFDQAKGAAVVTLVEVDGDRILPIFIGLWEGAAVFRELNRAPSQRPLLHDLFSNMLHGLHTRLEKIVIDSLDGNTFFAQLHLKQHDTAMIVDARPSDAIALALKCQAPIYIAAAVLEAAGKHEDLAMAEEAESPSATAEDVKAWLEDIRPEDFADPQ